MQRTYKDGDRLFHPSLVVIRGTRQQRTTLITQPWHLPAGLVHNALHRLLTRDHHGQGCIVEVEGRKRDKYWTFSVIDQSGLSLLRMSTQNEKDAESWVQVLMLFAL